MLKQDLLHGIIQAHPRECYFKSAANLSLHYKTSTSITSVCLPSNICWIPSCIHTPGTNILVHVLWIDLPCLAHLTTYTDIIVWMNLNHAIVKTIETSTKWGPCNIRITCNKPVDCRGNRFPKYSQRRALNWIVRSYACPQSLQLPWCIQTNKNIERHTADTIVSWPNPKQWVIVQCYNDLHYIECV